MTALVGLIIVVVAFLWSMQAAGQPISDYWDAPAAILVFLGAIGGATFCTDIKCLLFLPQLLLRAFLPLPYKTPDLVVGLQRMADKVRQGGLPALTSEIPVAFDEYTKRSIKLLVAGTDSHVVREVMEAEIEGMEARHKVVIAFFENIGGFGPTYGIMSTVLAIVQAMANIDDVSSLGEQLSMALCATFYGLFFANGFAIPFAFQLKTKNEKEVLMKTMIMEGLLAVQAGETSQMVGNRMKSMASDGERTRIEGGKGLSKKKGEKHIELTTYMNALDQEKALAFMSEIKQATEAKECGMDDVKQLLAQLINEADDKVLMKDFANEFMKIKSTKKLPKGSKMRGKRKAGGAAKKGKKAKKAAADDEE